MIIRPEDLRDEIAIHWLIDPRTMPYVRATLFHCGRRQGKPPFRGHVGELVGWADLNPKAEGEHPGCFRRRAFWLKSYDRYFDRKGTYETGCPSEATDPLTVAVGQLGIITDRAWGKSVVEMIAPYIGINTNGT